VIEMAINEVTMKTAVPQEPLQKPAAVTEAPAPPKISVQDFARVSAEHKTELMDQISSNLEKLDDAIEALNTAVQNVPTNLNFSVDKASKRFVVKVTDTETGEVIRKLPGDAVLAMAKQIESLKGVLFDDMF
jgi:flagellar protein FlaG